MESRGEPRATNSAHPPRFEHGTVGLAVGRVGEAVRDVRCDPGPYRDQFLPLGRAILDDIAAGRSIRRRDAIALARAVLESEVVRAAEAVLSANDATLLARLGELLRIALVPATHLTHAEDRR